MNTTIRTTCGQIGKSFRVSSAFIALAVVTGIWSASLQAQQELEEIIVTAERRATNLQDLPVAATVFTQKDIADKGINTVFDVQQLVPNVVINTYNRSTFFNIRGVGLAVSAPAAAPGVAYYIDGVFVPKEQHIAQSFFDLASLEVLRGPQGTLTGQNSTGGAVYARSPEPDFEAFSGYFDQTIGNYSWFRTTAAVNIPFNDNVAMRIAAIYESNDSYTDNIGPSPSSPGSGDFVGVRAKLATRITDNVAINFGFDYFNSNSDYIAIKNRNDQVTDDPFIIEEDAISFFNQDGWRAYAELVADTSADIRFRWITSVHRADQQDQADGDRTATALPIPEGLPPTGANRRMYPGRVSQGYNEFNYVISEANLLSTGDSPLQWVIGAFYMDEEIPLQLYRDNYHTTDFVSSSSDIETQSDAKSLAGFGQLNWRFNEKWEAIAGLRYSHDEFKLTRFILPGPPPPGGFPSVESTSAGEWTGKVGMNFYPSDETMFYATYTKGYKPGAVNLTPGYPNYDSEKNFVFEVGSKMTLLDNHMRLNTAIFTGKLEDFQLLSLLSVGGGPPLPTFQNGTQGKSKGVEVELVYANEGLQLNAAVGYLDAYFSQAVELNNGDTGMNELVPEGRPLPYAPKWTANGGVQYDFPIGDAGKLLTPRVQVYYIDEQITTPFPSYRTIIPARTIFDVKLFLMWNENFRLEAFVNNVFDKSYIAAQIQDASSADGGYLYGAPRVFGVRGTYQFE